MILLLSMYSLSESAVQGFTIPFDNTCSLCSTYEGKHSNGVFLFRRMGMTYLFIIISASNGNLWYHRYSTIDVNQIQAKIDTVRFEWIGITFE
jgi:hypothetical protein